MSNAILIVWVSVTLLLNTVHGSNLEEAVSELSAVSRLLNGMTIQNDFVEHPENTKHVIAEMLNVSKASLLDELNAWNVEGLSTNLTAFVTVVQGMPGLRTADVDEMNEGIRLLNDMRGSLDMLKTGAVQDPTSNMATYFGDGETSSFISALTKDNFNKTLEHLVSIKDQAIIDKTLMRSMLTTLQPVLAPVVAALKTCSTYTSSFFNFLKRATASDDLKTVREFGSIAEAFFNNSKVYQTLAAKSVSAKEDVNDLSALPSSQQFGQFLADIKNVSEILAGLTDDSLPKNLTCGLPNGSKDIAKIALDLKESRLLMLMSGGKDWKKVERSLGGVSKFGVAMAKLEESWGKVAGRKDVRSKFEEAAQLFSSISADVDKLKKIAQVGSALGKVVDCVGKLTNKTTTASFNDFKDKINAMSENGEGVKKFQNAVKTMLDGDKFSETLSDLVVWNIDVQSVGSSTPDDTVGDIYKKIKDAARLGRAMEIIKYAEQHILPFHTVDNIFIQIYTSTYIADVIKSLDGTGLYETVECLKNESYDASLVAGMLSVRADVNIVRTKISDMNQFAADLKQLGEVKKGYGEVQSVVGTSGTVKRGPFEMWNYQQKAQIVGKGVASLRSLTEIVNAKGDIAKVLVLNPAVHAVAERSRGMWNEETRNILKALPGELWELDVYAFEQKGKSVEKVWSVFGEAQKINHTDLNAKLLKDPIAVDLRKNVNTTLAAEAFEKLSHLDLRFAQHRQHSESASLSLFFVREFFDELFQQFGTVHEGMEPEVELMIMGGVFFALIFLAMLGMFVFGFVKQWREKMN